MKRRNMFKSAMAMALAGVMVAGMAVPSFAAGWQKNDTGWWYSTNADNTTWHANGWQWIDGNNDGVAECYYFDANGYMLANTTTPDGYTVNGDGAWTENGVVQIRQTGTQSQTQGDLPRTDVYESHGLSMAALDIVTHTRQENARYGEAEVLDCNWYVVVTYANGLGATYYLPGDNAFYRNLGDYPDGVGIYGDPKLIFKEDVAGDDEAVAKSLKAKGYDAYANGHVSVDFHDIGRRLSIHEPEKDGKQRINLY